MVEGIKLMTVVNGGKDIMAKDILIPQGIPNVALSCVEAMNKLGGSSSMNLVPFCGNITNCTEGCIFHPDCYTQQEIDVTTKLIKQLVKAKL